MCNYNASHVQPDAAKRIDQAQHIEIICNAKIAAHLVFFNIRRIDDDNNLDIILHMQQHAHLAVRLKPGEYARGVVIVEQLAAKFKIEFSSETRNPLLDMLGLCAQVAFIVKPDSFHSASSK